jgi:asparagine synthase (glutamine-hydrolysing)
MLRAIEHRGPDDWGMEFFGFDVERRTSDDAHVVSEAMSGVHLALGHRRLSILDLSESGRQPMKSHDGALTITFNGEIYNYIELRQELGGRSAFRTGTDTEVLLEAYRTWGPAMLSRLDGMFAFALWDSRMRRLVCARDPLGIKPFYFARGAGFFFFGSEPRAVLAGLDTTGHVDRQRIAEFLVLGMSDHDGGTSFEEVEQLRGGEWIEVDERAVVSPRTRFWTPRRVPIETSSDVAGMVRERLEQAVSRQLRADVTVGSCLSGGLDSGAIVTTVGRQLGEAASQFSTFTLANEGFVNDETANAKLLAATAGVRWVRVETRPEDIGRELEGLVRAMGEPFVSFGMYGQYKVMQRARAEGMKVMLDGQGGDEVFLGYKRMATRILREHWRHGRVGSLLREWHGLKINGSIPYFHSAMANIFFHSPAIAEWHRGRAMHRVVDRGWLEPVRREISEQTFRYDDLQSLQTGELTRYPLPSLLRYEDRNSMAWSLEARVPLLAVPLVDAVLPLPWNWKVRDGWTKIALRQAVADRLPSPILWQRRKLGFEIPQREWVRAAAPAIRAMLADLPVGAPIRRAAVEKALDENPAEPWLWRALSLAMWIRTVGVRI